MGAEEPGAVHRLDRRRGHRQWVPGWDRPLGPALLQVVTDVVVEDSAGHRTLYAPTQELAEFLAAAYAFDDIDPPPAVAGMVASASARRAMARSCATP